MALTAEIILAEISRKGCGARTLLVLAFFVHALASINH